MLNIRIVSFCASGNMIFLISKFSVKKILSRCTITKKMINESNSFFNSSFIISQIQIKHLKYFIGYTASHVLIFFETFQTLLRIYPSKSNEEHVRQEIQLLWSWEDSQIMRL
jgi:hypothetical protein